MYIMKLKEQYFNYIKFGTKTYEIRLNDEKRQKISLGDKIRFHKDPGALEEYFDATVIGLLRYNTFEELFKDHDSTLLADKSLTKEELLKVLEEFYPKEEQAKYGVLGIRIELL